MDDELLAARRQFCISNFGNIKGTYVSVEPFHLFRYLDEQAFRFNKRKNTDGQRFLEVISLIQGKRLEYKELIGAPSC